MKNKTNPALLMPRIRKSIKEINQDGKDFLETMDQLPDYEEMDENYELDELSESLHNYGWGNDE